MKINNSIERIKDSTRRVKRGRKGSEDMYESENLRTLAEINNTVEAKRRDRGSMRIEKLIWWALKVRRFHSIIIEYRLEEE